MPDLDWSFGDGGAEPEPADAPERGLLGRLAAWLRPAAGAPDADVVSRVFVLGTFGTDAVADKLAAVLRRRGRETHAVSTESDAARTRRGDRRSATIETVTVAGSDAAAPIREARALLGPPDVVVVTAVGRGELASLGPGRGDVVRSIAAAVPAGARVVNAEGSPAVAGYLETAVERRGATIDHVGEHDAGAPGAELAAAVDGALGALDEAPLPPEERGALLAASRPDWVELPDGRLFDAIGVTDTVAVERLRRALVDEAPVELVVAVPGDRRDVAAAVADYATRAHRREAVGTLHVVGPLGERVARRSAASTLVYDAGTPPAAVLDAALDRGPTLLAGSEDCEDGAALSAAADERVERSGSLRIG